MAKWCDRCENVSIPQQEIRFRSSKYASFTATMENQGRQCFQYVSGEDNSEIRYQVN